MRAMRGKDGYSRMIYLVLAVLIASGGWLGYVQPTGATGAAALISANSRFGIVGDVGTRHPCNGQQGGAVNLLAGSGASWVKEEFRWDWVQPSRDRWTWDCMDRAVNDERAKGLEILGQLDYTAGWAAGKSTPVAYTPPPLDLWANYVTQTVSRYKDRVHVWEVWNEPNTAVFWEGSKEQFAELQRVTYDTIKRVDPSARVLGPGISGVDEEWLDAMPWDKIDALSLHIYVPPSFLNDEGYSYYNQGLPNLKRVIEKRGAKPIWITEFGYSSIPGPDPWFVGSEGAQARYLVQYLAETLAYPGVNIEKVMPYVFSSHDGFELVHDFSQIKPAFNAYKAAIARLDGATARGRVNLGAGIFAFRFERDGKRIDMLWGANGATASVASGSDGEIYDLLGNRRTVGRSNGSLRVQVGADPIYLVYQATASSTGPQRFSQQQRTVFAKQARVVYLNAKSLAVLEQRCLKSCPELVPLLRYSSAAQAISAVRYGRLANGLSISSTRVAALTIDDREDYGTVASPEEPSVPTLTASQGLTQGEAEAGNAYLENQADQLALSDATETALARAEIAHEMNDEAAEGRQLQAAQSYANQQAQRSSEEPALLNNLQQATRSAGDEQSYSQTETAQYQNQVAQSGLPATTTETLGALHADDETRADVTTLMKSQDAEAVSALGGGAFPQSLTDPTYIQSINATTGALKEFAASRCYTKTGYCVSLRFTTFWQAHGDLAINGYPISEEFIETLDGKDYAVQYFERARFEYHPEIADPQYQVLLGQFGRRIRPADPPVGAIIGATFFTQTGHNITRAEFADFWNRNGGLSQFGYPLSEEFTERLGDGQEYRVQYFERARFEWHPTNPDPYKVQLGQFGRSIYEGLGR